MSHEKAYMWSILPEQGVVVSEREIEAFPDKCPFQDPKNTGGENSYKQSVENTYPIVRETDQPKGKTMDEMTETKTGLMNKKQDELTVGDAIKLNLGAIAAVAAAYGVAVGGIVGYNKYADWKIRRAMKKEFPEVIETTASENL